MKKLILFLTLLLFTACSLNIGDIDNTPTKKVEEYLNKYQSLSSDVVNDLDNASTSDVPSTSAVVAGLCGKVSRCRIITDDNGNPIHINNKSFPNKNTG